MKKFVLVLCVSLFLCACGGGRGSASSASSSIPTNSAGFPDVAGVYAFKSDGGTFNCSDGERVPYFAEATNIVVSQTGNVVTFTGTSTTPTPSAGMTWTYVDLPSGNIDRSGGFVITGSRSGNITSPLAFVVEYDTITGTFTTSGFSGTISISKSTSLVSETASGTCDSSNAVTGEKL